MSGLQGFVEVRAVTLFTWRRIRRRIADVNNSGGFGYHANESDKLNLHDGWVEECVLPQAAAAAAAACRQSTAAVAVARRPTARSIHESGNTE